MPSVVSGVLGIIKAIGVAAGATTTIGAYVAGSIIIASGVTSLATAMRAMKALDGAYATSDSSRGVTSKGTVEALKIVYGEAVVSGPISFVGVAGTNNQDLYHAISLCGHVSEEISDIYFDNEVISSSDINGSGYVTGGPLFGPTSGTNYVTKIVKYLGTQGATGGDPDLVANFTDYTTAHAGQGITYIMTRFSLTDEAAELWDKYQPQNIRAKVKGRKVYDPRADGTQTGLSPAGSGSQRLDDESTWTWSANPSLCVADYLTNTDFGVGIGSAKIDWQSVVTAANTCDEDVAITSTPTYEDRFTCNGALFATDSHRVNLNRLLSSMAGNLVYSNGVFYIKASQYEAPTETLTDDDLVAPIAVKTSLERTDRYNTVNGTFVNPAENHKLAEFPKIQLTAELARDNGEELIREIQLPFTNTSTAAQRIARGLILETNSQKTIEFPCNLRGMRIMPGDRVQVSIGDFSWTNKVFRCLSWRFTDGGDRVGVTLTPVSYTHLTLPTILLV